MSEPRVRYIPTQYGTLRSEASFLGYNVGALNVDPIRKGDRIRCPQNYPGLRFQFGEMVN